MTQRYEELIALLRRLFQLDRPDLDFGLYRGPWTPRLGVSASSTCVVPHEFEQLNPSALMHA